MVCLVFGFIEVSYVIRCSLNVCQISTLFLFLIAMAGPVYGQQTSDKLKQVGTESIEAADQFEKGVDDFQSQKFDKSLSHFKSALEHDSDFQLAMYWLAQAHEALGDHKNEIKTYQRLYDTRETDLNSVVIEGCINAGLSLGKRKEFEPSELWFSRALAVDPKNKFGKAASAYRNLAITKFNKQDFTSAAVVAQLGHEIDEERVPKKMVEAGASKANSEVASVVVGEHEVKRKFPYRDSLGVKGEIEKLDGISVPIGKMVDVGTERKLIVLPKDEKFLYVIDYSKDLKLTKVKTQGRTRAAEFVDDRLFLSITSPHRIAEFDIAEGKELKSWELDTESPRSFAVAPAKKLAFLSNGGQIQILDLESGKQSVSEFQATEITSDPKQEFVFGFRRPAYKSNEEHGQLLIRGKPIYFTIRNKEFNWSHSTLMRFRICEKDLLLSQLRIQAASNARSLQVSADGHVVSIVGGGGWRSKNRSSGTGYGVPFFNARDFSNVHRYVETGAYPQAAAISPVNHLIFAAGEKSVCSHIVNDDQEEIGFPEKITSSMFSGDGRWLFAGTESTLHAVQLEVTDKDR